MLDRQHKQDFAAQGYVVVRQAVSRGLLDAARREVARLLAQEPPPAGQTGPHFYNAEDARGVLRALFDESPAREAAESLIDPGRFAAPEQVQVSLNIPPFDHLPGGPHIDGLAPTEPDGRPGTFTLLAGFFLTDQEREDAGNLWVWPGTHLSAARYFREHGADALLASSPYPPVELPEPRHVTGRAGDLLLAHYMLGHNIGGNTSGTVREVVYLRLRREGHRGRWRECLCDPLLEFGPVRAAVGGTPGA